MCVAVPVGSISPDTLKAILILGFAAVILAGPLVYSILSGEKFGWFTDPRFRRPGKKQWQQMREKADRIIEGSIQTDANEIYELAAAMQLEVEGHRRHKATIEYERDRERITALYQKLQGMDLRVEPFDSLIERLKEDGLTEQAQQLHALVHSASDSSLPQTKDDLLVKLAKLRDQSWHMLSPDTKTQLKQSIKVLKHNPFVSLYVFGALILIGLGLRFYDSIVQNKGYKFYKEHPIWIAVFVVLIGVPLLILLVKFLIWKYAAPQNPYQSNLKDNR